METEKPLRNVLILGSTGGGKSSTVNQIVGNNKATVGKRMVACTIKIEEYESLAHKLRIIDCPGYNDNRFGKEKITEIMNELRKKIFPPEGNSSYQIDAFWMVIKCSPRAQSLADDLEQFTSMFGISALRTLQFIFIFTDDIDPDVGIPPEDEILKEILEMEMVLNLMKEAKRGEPSTKWFVPWSNKKPRSKQLEELLGSMVYLTPYTNQVFLTARKEIEDQIKKKHQKEIERYEKEFQKKYTEALEAEKKALKKKQEEEMAKMKEKHDADMKKNEQVREETLQYYKDMYEKHSKQQEDSEKPSVWHHFIRSLPELIANVGQTYMNHKMMTSAFTK